MIQRYAQRRSMRRSRRWRQVSHSWMTHPSQRVSKQAVYQLQKASVISGDINGKFIRKQRY